MIKRCKITNIINPPIRGVIDKPIREGNIVYLNCGQILTCLGISNVDEILPSGAVVRLNRDNYKTENSGITKNITITDSIKKEDKVEVKPVEKKEEPKVEPVVEETKVEEENITEAPVAEETKTEEIVEENTTEEVAVEEVKEETPVQNNQQNTKNNRKNNKK